MSARNTVSHGRTQQPDRSAPGADAELLSPDARPRQTTGSPGTLGTHSVLSLSMPIGASVQPARKASHA